MPAGCCEPDYDAVFSARAAERELEAYRRNGASGTTRTLVDAVRTAGVDGATVLDIGGGVGAVGLELLAAGAERVTDVDAARHYLTVARSEAERRGYADRTTFVHGDFVAIADQIGRADVVTLDRVICCYGDWRGLVDAAAQHTERVLGLAYPVDRWWTRAAIAMSNLVTRLARRRYRFYVHPDREVDARIRSHGFRSMQRDRGLIWQTVLYERAA